jgi:hypothetical protein
VLVAGALALLAATVWAIRRPTPAALFGIMWFCVFRRKPHHYLVVIK